MPLDYSVDHDTRRVTIVWHPPVEPAEVHDVVERVARDGAWSYGVLHDTRAVSSNSQANNAPLLEIVGRLSKEHGPRGPVALVAATETVGVAQAYAIKGMKVAAGSIQVFWDREEAEAWLASGRSQERRAFLTSAGWAVAG